MSFAATWMNLEIITLSKVSQTKTNTVYITYMWNLKNVMQINLQNRDRATDTEDKLRVAVGWDMGIDRGFRIDINILLCIKKIASKDLLYSTGN